MSSTRHAPPGTPLKQNRFASSSDIDRGLLANLVALRTQGLQDSAIINLIWWLQAQSHEPGGLAELAGELLDKWPD